MCKSHKFLMISNCDFLSSDIVISKSASGVRGPGPSVDRLRVRLQMSISSHLPSPASLARARSLSLSLVSPRSQLFIFGWRWKCREIQPLATVTTIPRKPGQIRPEPSRDDQADQASSDRMKS